jgi:hypothetical protein
MNNNIFLQNKKYNPDVISIFSDKNKERDNTKFNVKDELIDDISTSVGVNYKEKMENDKPVNDIDSLIKKRLNERTNEETSFKELYEKDENKQKRLPTSNPNDIKEFNELKNQNRENKENPKFNDILNDLADLGIIKK